MSGRIIVSPKHGANPSVLICFWCGNECGVVMMGLIGSSMASRLGIENKGPDPEAPRRLVVGGEPCDKCLEFAENGFVTIRAINIPEAEVERRGFAGANKNIRLEENISEIFGLLHPMIWRIRAERLAEIIHGIDISNRRFLFISMEAVESMGLPTTEEEAKEAGIERDGAWILPKGDEAREEAGHAE